MSRYRYTNGDDHYSKLHINACGRVKKYIGKYFELK